jgi:hypothetical protein
LTNGYSFLDDPNNPFLALPSALVTGIFNDSALLAKFTRVRENGSREFDIKARWKWMQSLAELEGLCMLATEMMSGAALRGTELASMLSRKTWNRGRNLRGLGQFVAIVREYTFTAFKVREQVHEWERIEQFVDWVSKRDSENGWPLMQLLKWVANKIR